MQKNKKPFTTKQIVLKLLFFVYCSSVFSQLAEKNSDFWRYTKESEEQIEWCKKQLINPESKEHLWASQYFLATLYDKLGDWNSALYWYLEAFQTDPSHTSSLQNLAHHYRAIGHNDLAYLFAHHGARIERSKNSNQFEFDVDLSISSYYTQFKEEGFKSSDYLILNKEVPWFIKDQTYRNIQFYVRDLPGSSFLSIEFERPFILGSQERYYPMNPSIIKTQEGYKVICRTVNYTQIGAKFYNPVEPSGMFRTRNFLLSYDRTFRLLSQKEIIEDLDRPRNPRMSIEGLEDCRLFLFDQSLWFSCTTLDTNPNQSQISLCKLSTEEISKSTISVERLIPLAGPDPNRCEKNWLPFVKKDELHLIYSYSPFVVYKPDLSTGICKTAFWYEPFHDFSQFRGSGSPIEFDHGYLMIIHEVVHLPDRQRFYLHRFVKLDDQLTITHVSPPFKFKKIGIEYCLGLTLDHSETRFIIPIGIEDHEAYFCFVDVDQVRNLLYPID